MPISYLRNVTITPNVWCYEQVCLAEMFKFSTNVIGKLAYSTCYVPFFIHKSIIMNWKRYRLKTYAVSDNRPLIFNPKYPWWCSGYGEDDRGEYSVIIAYLPKDEDLLKYWDDAFDVEFTEEESISFSDRFPKPSYFVS